MIGAADFPSLREKPIASDNVADIRHVTPSSQITDRNYFLPLRFFGQGDFPRQRSDNKIETLSRAAVIEGTNNHNRQMVILDIYMSQIFGGRFGVSVR